MSRRALVLLAAALLLAGGAFFVSGSSASISVDTPCVGAPAPAQWHHVVVVMMENTSQDAQGHVSGAPFVNGLVDKCGHSPKWNDANKKVDGTSDGSYNSKPSYAVLTNGRPATETGITSDTYTTKTGVDNIYNSLRLAGRNATSFMEGRASGDVCSGGGATSGSYHDPIRYYTDLPNAWCNAHDLDVSKFDPNNLPDFSVILPNNTNNWHGGGCGIGCGDTWLKNHLTPLLNSPQYASGDTAVFFLTDEESPVVNALIAPSVQPGSTVTVSGNAVSHYSGLRTFEDMLGLPYVGYEGQAPSLIDFFGGTTTTTTTQPTSTSTVPPTTTSTTNPPTTTTQPPTTTTTAPTGCQDGGTYFGPAKYVNVVYGDCVTSGLVWGTTPWDAPWTDFHRSAGWVVRGNAKISGTAVVNLGDGYHYEAGTIDLTRVRAFYMHDDAVENDRHLSGQITDSIFTSYVGYSDAGEFTDDGSANVVTFARNYVELFPIPGVYKGPSPGTGPWWKTDANSASLVLTNNIFVAHQAPNHGTLGPPTHVKACNGNVIFWGGTGPFPARAEWLAACPDTVIVGP